MSENCQIKWQTREYTAIFKGKTTTQLQPVITREECRLNVASSSNFSRGGSNLILQLNAGLSKLGCIWLMDKLGLGDLPKVTKLGVVALPKSGKCRQVWRDKDRSYHMDFALSYKSSHRREYQH